MSLFAKKNTYVVFSSGTNRDSSKETREQPSWDEHAAFIDRLVAAFELVGRQLGEEAPQPVALEIDGGLVLGLLSDVHTFFLRGRL